MTNGRRLQTIEETLGMLAELNQSVVAMLASHSEQLASLREDNRTMKELLTELREDNKTTKELLAEVREDNKTTKELLAEVREDNRMTRNLWVNLAKRYGWLEDEDFQN